jgi:CRP-like cAMP-binding protein
MSEKLWFLKRCKLFEQVSDELLQDIESTSRARSFPRNSPIYLPADEGTSVFLLASGRVKICHLTPEGKQSILAFIDPGELFGELALLADGPREEYAEAVDASTVVMISGETMQRVMAARPELSLGVTKLIGLRRRRIEQRLKNLLFLSNRDRLTHLLLELAEQYGQSTPEGVRLGIQLSHQDLANVIGSTRETVTVVLGEMQQEQLLSIGRRKIVITGLDRLAASVQKNPPRLPGAAAVAGQPATRPM